MKRFSSILLQPNPGLRARLTVNVSTSAQVVATLVFTNVSAHPLLLYRPLLGQGKWEELFFVMTNPGKENLPYQGSNREHSQGKARQRIVLTGEEPAEDFLKLAAGETITVEKNLSDVFDFRNNPGSYWVRYSTAMPLLVDGTQLRQLDPRDQQEKPVYYSVNSSIGATDEETYVAVIIP